MPLLSIPKELEGLKLTFKEKDTATGDGEWVLPDDATPEQIKAFREYRKRTRQAQRDMCVIEE